MGTPTQNGVVSVGNDSLLGGFTKPSENRISETTICRLWSIDINRTPVSKTRPLSPYQLTHDKVMQAWTSDIHAAARQERHHISIKRY